MRLFDLGLTEYATASELQRQAALLVEDGGPESLFLLEHPPTITFGKNGGEEYLPFGREFFTSQGVQLIQSSRGGSITCHFPGQLVAYPIMRIDKRQGGLRRFFHDMEESVIRTLSVFGLNSERIPGKPGVWVQGKKICSTGIAVKRWISRHGLSLNIGNDLSLFELVTPCGLPGVRATSLQRELATAPVDMESVKQVFLEAFQEVFSISRFLSVAEQPDRQNVSSQ